MSAPTEALGLEPNWDRRPGEWSDIRPHGTEARAMRHRRHGEKPCPACRRASSSRRAEVSAPTPSVPEPQADEPQMWITEVWCPQAGSGLQALHPRMLEPDPEPEAEL